MENQMENRQETPKVAKRRVLLIAVVVCVAAMLTVGTLAYFTDEETVNNIITMGKVDVSIYEETTDGQPFPEEGVDGVMPGEAVDKKVYAKNDGTVDVYVRIKVDKVSKPANLNLDGVTMDFDTEHWTEKDGYYYYNAPLTPGSMTEPLFTKVFFDSAMNNDYKGATIQVNVKAHAVQCKNNTDSPLTAVGWAE